MLVIAVRGTAGKADRMINMNDHGKEVESLFVGIFTYINKPIFSANELLGY